MPNHDGKYAIDGNHGGIMAHSNCNDKGKEIWLKLWFRRPVWIDHITIYPSHTANYNYYRFQGARLYIEHSGLERYCDTLTLDTWKTSHELSCGVPLGEVVVLRLTRNNKDACIHVYEIEAFGQYMEGKGQGFKRHDRSPTHDPTRT
eukprot:sb/3473769/